MKKRRIFFILFALCLSLGYAQVGIQVEIDSSEIFIGEQCAIRLKVTALAKDKVVFPVFPDKQLTPGIEILNEDVVASEKIQGGTQLATTKEYLITSFDSSFYYIPPFKVRVNDKEYESKSLALKVITMDVDTLHLDKFCGPKEIADVPFSWQDWRLTFWMSLILVLLLAFTFYIMAQLNNNRPLLKLFRLRPVLPPHVWAMGEIEKLKATPERNENTKEYYSELTDVLRSYIWRRYGFNAREMTSGEIISRLTEMQDASSLDELRELFATADLAKFAKLQTLLNENDANLLKAMKFIETTKLEETEKEQPKKEVPKEIKRTNRERLALKISVAVLLLISAGLLFEIGRNIYNFLY